MTLEARLVSYDWDNQFHSFQEATMKGSFKPLCWTAQSTLLPVSAISSERSYRSTVFSFSFREIRDLLLAYSLSGISRASRKQNWVHYLCYK